MGVVCMSRHEQQTGTTSFPERQCPDVYSEVSGGQGASTDRLTTFPTNFETHSKSREVRLDGNVELTPDEASRLVHVRTDENDYFTVEFRAVADAEHCRERLGRLGIGTRKTEHNSGSKLTVVERDVSANNADGYPLDKEGSESLRATQPSTISDACPLHVTQPELRLRDTQVVTVVPNHICSNAIMEAVLDQAQLTPYVTSIKTYPAPEATPAPVYGQVVLTFAIPWAAQFCYNYFLSDCWSREFASYTQPMTQQCPSQRQPPHRTSARMQPKQQMQQQQQRPQSQLPAQPQETSEVQLTGLPPNICTAAMLEAILDQAGIEDSILNISTHVDAAEKSGDATITFASSEAAVACQAHFQGCRWAKMVATLVTDTTSTSDAVNARPPSESATSFASGDHVTDGELAPLTD